ncbi:RNA polymerase sigma factor [uncultured Bacteroides sp.]|uniref:RNA polymerase sigma factor n=1 Tax=uncultured Bacteroides sp. TaxID=162156 RepID=UPI0025D0E8E1|nr:RNA polymerase sigma factor [uncultured Bacteroides sp.]
MMDNREVNIINRFLHGDHEAYSLLYREHVQELFSYGKALTGNDERLKDAIQDVFYKILSNPSTLKDVQNLKYFLFKSLKNRLIDILKSEMHQSQSGEAAYERFDFTINDVTVLDSLIEEEERLELSRKIKLLLNRLTARQREAVCLRYIYDMEYDEIADLLNMSNSKSARNLVSRALEHLRKDELELFILLFYSINQM